MSKIQARVPDDLAERIEQAAKADGRSVSNWVRVVLERELDGRAWQEATAPLVNPVLSEAAGRRPNIVQPRPERVPHPVPRDRQPACPHANTKREKMGASGLVMTKCVDCGGFLKV